MRSVIGQGRLVMAERFAQFSGLVDNCEFKQGEKETTCMDLKGFWEMIYFQVFFSRNVFSKVVGRLFLSSGCSCGSKVR